MIDTDAEKCGHSQLQHLRQIRAASGAGERCIARLQLAAVFYFMSALISSTRLALMPFKPSTEYFEALAGFGFGPGGMYRETY
jgi:hypothetical protein